MKKVLAFFVLTVSLFSLQPVFSSEDTEILCEEKTVQYSEVFTDGVSLSEVHNIIENYTGNISISSTTRILENSTEYRAYVRKRLSELEMPSCLEYLPIIESDYKPTAKPPAGTSMGLWQFMPNSVSPYMELSEYVDERRDPWISTEGALKKLAANYRQFGDWLLALAAYNCGAGAVKRGLSQAKDKTYTGLCTENLIPDHAKAYVKRFLALSNIIINAEFFGYDKLNLANQIDGMEDTSYFFYDDFDYVTVTHSIRLDVLAMELKLDYDILRNLNLSLIKNITPPGREYRLRLPKGMGPACTEAIVNLITKQFLNKE